MHNKKYKKCNELDKMLPNVAKVLCIHGDFLKYKKRNATKTDKMLHFFSSFLLNHSYCFMKNTEESRLFRSISELYTRQ